MLTQLEQDAMEIIITELPRIADALEKIAERSGKDEDGNRYRNAGRYKTVNKYEVVMEKVAEYKYYEPIYDPEAVYRFLKNELKLDKRPEEHFVVLSLDSRGDLVGIADTAIGGLNQNRIESRAVFRQAIMQNAAAIIVAHNHPSGSVTPSDDDISVTERLKKCGEVLEIPVQDHVVIGDGFSSMKELEFC